MVEPRGHEGRVDQLEDRFVRNEEAASSQGLRYEVVSRFSLG